MGREINRNDIGLLFQLGDPLRRQVSSVIVALCEDGTYQKIDEKWFGVE